MSRYHAPTHCRCFGKQTVIAKSDLIILVVSSSLLAVAIYRWDQNTRNVDTSTVLANTTVSAPASSSSSVTIDQTLTTTSLSSNNGTADGAADYVIPADAEQSVTTVVVPEPEVVETVTPYATHVVRSGDSLSEIAVRYNTSINELRSLNGINGSTIFIGQEILYPSN